MMEMKNTLITKHIPMIYNVSNSYQIYSQSFHESQCDAR